MKDPTMRALRERTFAIADAARGGSSGKVETMLMVDAGDTGHLNAETGASLGQDVEAATNADFTAKQS